MIITIVGLPGRITSFCRDVCVAVLTHAGQPPLTENVDTVASLARHVLTARHRTLVVTATRPERELLDAIQEADRPFLFVLDDPRWSVLQRVQSGEIGERDAILEIGMSCACVTDVLPFERAVRVTNDAIRNDASGFITGLLAVLDLPPDDPDLVAAARAAVQRHLPSAMTDRGGADIDALLESELGPIWGPAATAALSGYSASFFGGKLGRLVALRQMFLAGEPPYSKVADVIDATGRPRILAFGPYIRIPRGQWMLRMTLAFSSELVAAPFSLDIVCFESRVKVELGRVSFAAISGRYVAQATFAHDEPSLPLEFRLFLDKATFDGQVAIGSAELERMEDQTPPDLGQLMHWHSGT